MIPVVLRHVLVPADEAAIRRIVTATDRFHSYEIDVACELVRDNLAKGDRDYWFTLAESEGNVVGYACYGPIACTRSSFDLYWIAVHPDLQGRGLGTRLVDEAEKRILQAGGTHVFIDTSSRADYAPTRQFYERCGYRCEARLTDFYAPGDHKVVYAKSLTSTTPRAESPAL